FNIQCKHEQHVEVRKSRQTRDSRDVDKLINWFTSRFTLDTGDLISISSGITADERVNCDQAVDIGTNGVKKLIGQSFGSAHLSRKDRVVNLASVKCSKDNGNIVTVDTMTLLNRILCVCKKEEELHECFGYELSPYPLSLFDEGGMRKTRKSVLYEILEK